jgi:hypothetical protein
MTGRNLSHAAREIAFGLGVAALVLVAAAALRYAEAAEILGGDGARRAMQILVGLVLAAYGDRMPKAYASALQRPCRGGRIQSVIRVGGWSMTLAGLGYAALWALAPLAFADVASMALVGSACAVLIGYGGWALAICRPSADQSL